MGVEGGKGQTWIEDSSNPAGGYWTYTITSEWKATEMTDTSLPDPLWEGGGIKLVYAGPHCHAPSCLGMELWNVDTDELLCKMAPEYGDGKGEKFDEFMYATLPPCIYSGDSDSDSGGDDDILSKQPFLPWNTTIKSICIQNSTTAHYGQMASWQMRGYYVNGTSA